MLIVKQVGESLSGIASCLLDFLPGAQSCRLCMNLPVCVPKSPFSCFTLWLLALLVAFLSISPQALLWSTFVPVCCTQLSFWQLHCCVSALQLLQTPDVASWGGWCFNRVQAKLWNLKVTCKSINPTFSFISLFLSKLVTAHLTSRWLANRDKCNH